MSRKPDALTWLVARLPAGVHAKLLAAFLAIVALFIVVGAVGLTLLSGVNERAEGLIRLQRRIVDYRDFQRHMEAQLHLVSSALLLSSERALEAALQHLDQVAPQPPALGVLSEEEREMVRQFRDYYNELLRQKLETVRGGRPDVGRPVGLPPALPLVDRIGRMTDELAKRAEADMVSSLESGRAAYRTSRRMFIGFALGSIGLALLLGYAISWSLIGPVWEMDARFREIARGDFSRRVSVPNRDEMGALAANLNRMSDELRRLYRELEAANRRLEAASRHKSEFLASMSHELRTPLNAVIGFSEVLRERMFGELNAKQAEYVEDIISSAHHLLALINDILDLSKIEAGRMQLELSPFDLRAALENALTFVKERAGRRRIALELVADERLGHFLGDERKIRQVVLNLLSNAVKFTPEGGRITVTAKPADGAVEIAVSDSGVGIAPEDQDAIFEEFRQVGGDSAEKREGTGLGLALAKRFVELHGGGIGVRSELGEGSTFTVALPVRQG